jgi:hypothetical protein
MNKQDWVDTVLAGLERLDKKLDELTEVSIENKLELVEHKRRSVANEEANRLTQEKLELYKAGLEKKLKPVEVFMDRVKFLFAAIGTVAAAIMFFHSLGIV